MTNYSVGHTAEKTASEYLLQRGFQVLELNWKTRYCEIDIVAQKKKVVYLIEAKYRRTNLQGSGLDYITPKKLNQMRFAAEMWAHDHTHTEAYQLAVISMDGDAITFVEVVT